MGYRGSRHDSKNKSWVESNSCPEPPGATINIRNELVTKGKLPLCLVNEDVWGVKA